MTCLTRPAICVLVLLSFCYGLEAQAPNVKLLNIDCNAMVFYSTQEHVIIALPQQDGAGPRIAFLDPAIGTIVQEVGVSGEVHLLAISDDESVLYAGTATRVLRYTLPTLTLQDEIVMAEDEEVLDIEILPGQSQSFCVATDPPNVTTLLSIYDGDQRRPESAPYNGRSMTFANSDTILYAYNNSGSAFIMHTFAISAEGIRSIDERGRIVAGFDQNIEYAKGSIWSDKGYSVDVSEVIPRRAGRLIIGEVTQPQSAISPSLSDEMMYVYSSTGEFSGHHAHTFNPVFNYPLRYALTPRDMITWRQGLNVAIRVFSHPDHPHAGMLIINDCDYSGPDIQTINRLVHGCVGDTVWLTAQKDSDLYFWSTGEHARTIAVTQNGTYHYTIPDASGCVSPDVEVFEVRFDDYDSPPTIVLDKQRMCYGEENTLEAHYSPGEADDKFIWLHGDTAQAVTVDDPGEYAVYVVSIQGCTTPVRVVTIDTIPHQAPAKPSLDVDGSLKFCPQEIPVITAPAGFAHYRWQPFFQADTNIVTVNLSWYLGSVSLVVEDSTGCESVSSDTLHFEKLNVATDTPVITLNGSTLASSIGVGNQWLRNGAELSTAQGQFYTADSPGLYQTRVDQKGCYVGLSNVIAYMTSAVSGPVASAYRIYPNPGFSLVKIEAAGTFDQMELYNATGVLTAKFDYDLPMGSAVIDVSNVPSGLYFIHASNGRTLVFIAKLLKI